MTMEQEEFILKLVREERSIFKEQMDFLKKSVDDHLKEIKEELEDVDNNVSDINNKLFILKENGDPPIVEQVHLNTEHRKEHNEKKTFLHNTWVAALISQLIGTGIVVWIFYHFHEKF